MVEETIIGGFSGASVIVELVMAHSSTIPGTYSIIVVIWTTAVETVAVSEVLLKVVAKFLCVFFIFRELAGVSASFPFCRGMEFCNFRV